MALVEMDFAASGGGLKKVTGSWSVVSGDNSVTVSDLTNVRYLEFALNGAPQYCGTASHVELYSDTLVSCFYNAGTVGTALGVTSMSGNSVGFKWNNPATIDYIAYGE